MGSMGRKRTCFQSRPDKDSPRKQKTIFLAQRRIAVEVHNMNGTVPFVCVDAAEIAVKLSLAHSKSPWNCNHTNDLAYPRESDSACKVSRGNARIP